MMAHYFDAIIEIRTERSAEHVRHYLSIQKMRMTAVPTKMLEIESEGLLVSLKTVQKIT